MQVKVSDFKISVSSQTKEGMEGLLSQVVFSIQELQFEDVFKQF